MTRTLLLLVFALVLAVAACSGSSGSVRCVVGATVPCLCASGASGSQTCLADGSSRSPCACGIDDVSRPDADPEVDAEVEVTGVDSEGECGPVDIELETGAMTMVANLQVLPIWLHLILDIAVDADTGKAVIIGTFARLKPDDPSYPTNYPYPAAHEPELGEAGWAVSFTGCVTAQGGGYVLQSDPFDLAITVLGTIPVTLSDFQLQGTIVPRGATAADCGDAPGACEGRDKGAGTLSTSGGRFGDPPTDVEPITTAWIGYGFTAAELGAFLGLPRVCAAAPCATLSANGGDCQLEAPWSPGDVCE